MAKSNIYQLAVGLDTEGQDGEKRGQEEKWREEWILFCQTWRERDKAGFLHALQKHLSTKYGLKMDNNHLLSGSHWHINGSVCKSKDKINN